MLTTEELAAIHRALTVANGKRAEAAAALGLTCDKLGEKIRESKELAQLWSPTAAPPSGVDTYDRERPDFELMEPVDLGLRDHGQAIDPKAASISASIMEQNSKLQKFDWEGLGIKEKTTIDLMRQFEVSVGRGVVRLLDAMCGGMGFCFAQVSARFAYAAGKLEEPAVKADPIMFKFWHDVFMDCAREMKGFNKEATNAAHTRLLIADRARKMQSATDKMRKPGWKSVTPKAAPAASANGGTNHG